MRNDIEEVRAPSRFVYILLLRPTILLRWALIAATLLAFARLHRLAAVLLLPYLAWVGFAYFLTWTLWQRNP